MENFSSEISWSLVKSYEMGLTAMMGTTLGHQGWHKDDIRDNIGDDIGYDMSWGLHGDNIRGDSGMTLGITCHPPYCPHHPHVIPVIPMLSARGLQQVCIKPPCWCLFNKISTPKNQIEIVSWKILQYVNECYPKTTNKLLSPIFHFLIADS